MSSNDDPSSMERRAFDAVLAIETKHDHAPTLAQVADALGVTQQVARDLLDAHPLIHELPRQAGSVQYTAVETSTGER